VTPPADTGTSSGLSVLRHSVLRILSRVIGALTAFSAGLGLAGFAPLNAGIALALLFGGLALLFDGFFVLDFPVGRLLSGVMLPFSFLPALGLLSVFHLGDIPLLSRTGGIPPRPDSSMALPFLALALFLIDRETGRRGRPSEWLALASAIVVFPDLLGYLYGIRSFFLASPFSTRLSPFSAFLIASLAFALFCARPDRGFMGVIMGERSGGMMARRLVPAAILVPPLAGWLRLYGERNGYYDLDLGLALFATLNVLIFVGLVLWNARTLDEADGERRNFRLALERSNEELEAQVRSRTEELREANAALEARIGDLRKSEGKFRDLIEAAPDAIVITDQTGRIALVNRQALETFGYAACDLPGRTIEILVPERFRKDHILSRTRYCQNPGYRPMDPERKFYALRKDGTEFPAEISLNPGRSGDEILIVAIVRDISERVRTEESLRAYREGLEEMVLERTRELEAAIESLQASEERYRLLSDASLMGVYLIQDDLFRYVNPAFAKIFGCVRDDIVDRMGPKDLTAPEDRGLVADNIRRRLDGTAPQLHYCFRGMKKDGERVDVEVQGVRILYRGRLAITGSLLDLTERNRTRDLLARQSNDLEKANRDLERRVADLAAINRVVGLLESSPDLPALFGSIAKEILEISGGSLVFIFHPDPESGTMIADTSLTGTGSPVGPGLSEEMGELAFQWRPLERPALFGRQQLPESTLWKSGIEVLVLLPLPGSSEPSGVLVLAFPDPSDIAGDRLEFLENLARQLALGLERARLHARALEWAAELERQVARRTSDLEATNREIESFSYSVSHDLRAPLRAIDGFSQALIEDYSERLDLQGQDFLARVRNAAQRMGQLIDDLLDLSRVTRNEVVKEKVNLGAMAEDILGEAVSRSRRKVDWSVAPGLDVWGDPRLLRIALTNLLDNALKYTKFSDPARIEVGWFIEADIPVYYVRDNGIGFDMARAGKLFGAFQRFHDPREFPGNGIGLATVQRVVRKHGGKIRAESAPGEGATFFFTLEEEKGWGFGSASGPTLNYRENKT